MSRTIRIPINLYARLERHAKGFDTPASVIERLLNSYEDISPQELEAMSNEASIKTRDNTRYFFEGSQYGKGRIVLAVIKKYVDDNPNITFTKLLSVFPKAIQGSIGVFNKYEFVQEKYIDKQHKRHFVKPEEIIRLSDCSVAVCTEWGIGNINNFLNKVKELGYDVTTMEE